MGFVVSNLVTNLAVDVVVGKMVAAAGDDWIATLAIVSGLANVDI